MVEREIEIINRLGLHARAAAKLVHAAGAFRSRVSLIKDGEVVDGKSILGILLMAAAQGTTFSLRCEGEDEAAALESVATLVANRFGESE